MERYKIVRTLSSSFCTTCALVEDQWTGKRYFTKTLFLSNATKIHIHQFRTEIHVLSLMDDPYIPHLIDVIEEADQIMIIETWIPGKNMDEDDGREKTVSIEKTMDLRTHAPFRKPPCSWVSLYGSQARKRDGVSRSCISH